MEELTHIEVEARDLINGATDLDTLKAVDADLLGRSAPLTAFKKDIGKLAPEDRKDAGQALNRVRTAVQEAIEVRRNELEAAQRAHQLEDERLDLSEVLTRPQLGHLHITTQTWQLLEDVFVGMGFTVSEGPEIESEWYNFGSLNFPPDHPARDMYDTLYVEYGEPGSTLLRTHTSPVQMRVMENEDPPIYTIAPGRVFRQDTADATHMPVFHQIEGLVVDRGITLGDLAGTIEAFTTAYFGGSFTSRLRPSYFPFTEPSAEFDILMPNGEWLELGGCGMVHPSVLGHGGLDPEEWSGFAFGFGLDRLALMKFGVDDLRELWSNDVRFLRQF
ncbi:MAG: phenylalanine--tRNA ligase subunit alpha [Actinomycetia bacterium]|nr:phenylalanine--tRNA ligase subunit alpha [Actinomycetes bacterium]